MTPAAGVTGLWEKEATACRLVDGEVYHYWFEVEDTSSGIQPPPIIQCTDPMAFTVDWRVFPRPEDNTQPAAVIKFENGNLLPCDPDGSVVRFDGEVALDTLPSNNRLVIYELPTAWVISRGISQNPSSKNKFSR
jgi:pullulanase